MHGPSPVLHSPAYFQNPYPTWKWLRENDPVHRFLFPGTDVPVWLVTRYDDVRAILEDPRFSNDPDNASRQFQDAGLGFSMLKTIILSDPPDHTRLRKLAMKPFTPRNTEKWRSVTEDVVDGLLDEAAGRGEMDVVRDFAAIVPAEVLGRILGVGMDRRKQVLANLQEAFSGDPERIRKSSEWLLDNARELVAYKRANPGDDLTTQLIEAREGSDRLGEAELVALVQQLVAAGIDTTQNLIANATLALLDHPDQLAILREDTSIMPQAVEEFLRYDGAAVVSFMRFAMHDLEFGGVELPAGAAVWPALQSANHDHDHFPEPDRLDLSRTAVRHVGMGHGLHNCMGAALARLEVRIAMSALLSRFPSLALAVSRSELCYQPDMFVRRLKSLPVRLS